MNEPEPTPSPGRSRRPDAAARCRRREPGARRSSGAGSFGTALAVLLARGGLRTTLQTRTRRAGGGDRPRHARTGATCPGVELPGGAADRARLGGRRARRLRLPRGPLARPRRGDRHARRGRAGAAHGDRVGRQGPRAAGRRPPTIVLLSAAFRRRARRLPGRPGARPGDGHATARRSWRPPATEELARVAGAGLHARGRRLRAVQRPRRRRAGRRGEERGGARRRRHRGAGAERGRRRGRAHLRRGVALRRGPGRAARSR